MPYPLPSGGPPYSTALRWFLVAVPDEREFVQAALGAYTELGYFYKWGLEKREDGQHEAADVWKAAIAATLEALEMGFPDTLLGYIDNVETLLQSLIDKPCCAAAPTNVVPSPTLNMLPTTLVDGSGTVPSSYGADTTIVDWSEWDAHKCGMSKELAVLPANLLEELLGSLELENQPGWIEYIGDLLGKIPGVGEVAKVLFDTFAGLLAWGVSQFVGADDAIALIRAGEDAIACAMYQADGENAAATAMKQATLDSLGEYGHGSVRLGLEFFPWDLWAHVLYTGQFEDKDGNLVNVPHTPATDCCIVPYDWDFTWDINTESGASWGFIDRARSSWQVTALGTGYHQNGRSTASNAQLAITNSLIRDKLALASRENLVVQLIEVTYAAGASHTPRTNAPSVAGKDAAWTGTAQTVTDGATETKSWSPTANRSLAAEQDYVTLWDYHNGDAGNTVPDDQVRIVSVRLAGTVDNT